MVRALAVAAAAVVAAAALTGCGASSPPGDAGARVTTVPAYAGFPPDTITVSAASSDSPTCRVDARSFVRTSRVYLAHAGPQSAYPSDAYYMVMREELTDFQVRRCDAVLLGGELAHLTKRQIHVLETDLPHEMAATIRSSLAAAGS